MMPTPFTHNFRVRYAELDPQSVVFNSRYLEYADLLITEYWREIGLHFTGDDALEFHVVKAQVLYRKPIRADEEIAGSIWTERIGTTSVTTKMELRGVETGDLRAEIETVHVHVDLGGGRPTPIPDAARARLAGGKD